MLESFHAKKREITATVAEIVTLGTRIGARSLAAKVEADLVKKLEADRFHLVVVGEFNHGKTTFVNALLGKDLLPVGVTPTTAVIHHLEYGDAPGATVVYESGQKASLAVEDVKKYAVSGALASSSEHGDVKYLEVSVASPILKERIVLVDTPGVNDLSLQRADITYSYIPKSDAVLFLLDAGQPLKESERVFIQEKLLARARNKIIFVVTKRDIWDPSEEAEALRYIRTELDKILPGAPLFPVSAEKALAGDRSGSGIDELIGHLMSFLAEERGPILLKNAVGQANEVTKLIGKGIDARKRAVQMSANELSRRIEFLEKDLAGKAKTIEERRAAIREEISAIKAWVRRDLEHFVDDVIKQIPAIVDAAKPDEIKLHLGPFLERTIVEWVQKETKEIGAALEALAEKTIALVRDDANDSAKRLSDAFGQGVKAPDIRVDTIGYDFGVVAALTAGVGFLFTNVLLGGGLIIAAIPLAWYTRNKKENLTRDKAREVAPGAVREAAALLGPKLDSMIADFAQKLDAWVVSAGEDLHKELIEILRQAEKDHETGAAEVAGAVAVCDEELAQLGRIEARLAELGAAAPAANKLPTSADLQAALPPPEKLAAEVVESPTKDDKPASDAV
jgi:GTP-binding protein EngB required for normal cell division